MSYHKLLLKQIDKNLPEEIKNNPGIEKLLSVINDSYVAYERDKVLAERAFSISEQEYIEINEELKKEVDLKKLSISKLKEAIVEITEGAVHEQNESDELLEILAYLRLQINKRKTAEELWQFALEGAGDGVWEYDFETNEAFFSKQYKKMLGYEDEEFDNDLNEWLSRIHPDDIKIINESDEEYFSKEICSHNREYRIKHKDGNYVWILDRGKLISYTIDDKPKRIIGTHTDITDRKKTEEDLKRISVVASANENGILFTDAEGKIFWSNEGFSNLTGYSAEEVIGKTPFDLVKGPLSNRDMLHNMLDAFYSGRSFNMEIIHYRKDGTWFWGRVGGQATFDDTGKVVQYFAMIEDISHEKEQEEQFRSLAENIPGVLYRYEYLKNGDEGFVYISPDAEKKIGISAEQLMKFYDILHPDDFEREKEISWLSREKKTPYNFEGRFNVPGKPVLWLNISSSHAHTSSDGNEVHTGIIINTTKEKEAELALQINEEKYRSIITNMNLGLMEVNNDEEIQFVNQSFCEMSGYTQEELTGKKASSIFVKNDYLELVETKNLLRRKGVSDAYEIATKNKKGEMKWWLISAAPRHNDKGELVGSIGIHLDITDQKELQNELIEARKQAESSANAKQSFLANMSHEIRTPMNAILGMSRQLQKTALNKQQNLFLQTIKDASENLLVVINDILDISKIEAGKLSLELIGFRIREVIKRSMQVVQHRAEEKGLMLVSSIDENIAPVFLGDPYRLNQLLLNLLSNSIKFSNKGSIRITCSLIKEKSNKQVIQLKVADNGIGMEEGFMKNLFQSFTQEDKSVSRKYGGTGLGMAITKQLVELMGGNIVVDSKKNFGTNITLTIPFTKGDVNDLSLQDTKKLDSAILKDKKILLVEDNEMNRLVATTTLAYYGALITEAENGAEAIEALRQSEYDLVLMDMQMPVMDGIEASVIIRKQLNSTIPIIALTANAIKGENKKCIDAGMNDYISKPFEENELVNKMAKWLREKEIMDENKEKPRKEELYNLSKLKELSRGDDNFVKKMLTLFINQVPTSLEEIHTALEENDFPKIKAVAHRIKPSIDIMCIHSLKNEIREIENLALLNKHSKELNSLIQQMEITLKKIIRTIKVEA